MSTGHTTPAQDAASWAAAGWSVAPYATADPTTGCDCPAGPRCTTPGGHLIGVRPDRFTTAAPATAAVVTARWAQRPTARTAIVVANHADRVTGEITDWTALSLGPDAPAAVRDACPFAAALPPAEDGVDRYVFAGGAPLTDPGVDGVTVAGWTVVAAGGARPLPVTPAPTALADALAAAAVHVPTPALLPARRAVVVAPEGNPVADEDAVDDAAATDTPAADVDHGDADGGKRARRPSLNRLMADTDPDDPEAWLGHVAHHLGRVLTGDFTGFRATVARFNLGLPRPLGDAAVDLIASLVWDQPAADGGEAVEDATEDNGLTVAAGPLNTGYPALLTPTARKVGDAIIRELKGYTDFTVRVTGVATASATGEVSYLVKMVCKGPGGVLRPLDAVLPGSVLGDPRTLERWLASRGCTLFQPDGAVSRGLSPHQRLHRFIRSQDAPSAIIADTLGWHRDALGKGVGGFVTADGVITAEGFVPAEEAAVRVDPSLEDARSEFRYGFTHGRAAALDALAQVMTFQDDTVTAVFGSWVMSAVLSDVAREHASMFPIMALEAPSESGKTNGFFGMLLSLVGQARGERQVTVPVMRDLAALHPSGPVWVDDMDDVTAMGELLRASTSAGTLSKKGLDGGTVSRRIVAPIVLSGEGLGLDKQKALADRSVILAAPSPRNRKSERDPSRSQWDDVVALQQAYPDGLSELAGDMIATVLGHRDAYAAHLRSLRGTLTVTSRLRDRAVVLLGGAWLLDRILGGGEDLGYFQGIVRGWLAVNAPDPRDNSFTLEMLPWVLREFGVPVQGLTPAAARVHHETLPAALWNVGTPAWVTGDLERWQGGEPVADGDEPRIVFSPKLLADAWAAGHRVPGGPAVRTQTETALRDQARAAGCVAGGQVRLTGAGSSSAGRVTVWVLPVDLSARVLQRMEG